MAGRGGEGDWEASLGKTRHRLAVACISVADTEDRLAATFAWLARLSPDRAERLTSLAEAARDHAILERSRAQRYGGDVPTGN